MAKTLTLKAEARKTSKHSARETRAAARVPAVVYGGEDAPVTISVDASDVLRTYRVAGQSAVIDLEIAGKKEMVIIHDMQIHPVRTEIWHVDFKRLSAGQKTDVSVPIMTTGESPAVKNHGGLLTISHETITIRCLPKDIPHDFTLDVSTLAEIHDHLTIKDLNLDPKKYEVMGYEEDEVLVTIIGRAAEKEEETMEEGAEAAEGGEAKPAEGGE